MKVLKAGARECFQDLPLCVNWVLTHRCNYRCSYCFVYGKGKKHPHANEPFSTLEQLKTAVDNIASLNRPWYNVILSGGEPTIHPHITDLISMFYERLGDSLNVITIISNGSRNEALYRKIASISKHVNFVLNISIHTDHVEMAHILELIENLSGDLNLYFSLMFNPDKREMVHEIYDTMFEYRKKFWFTMNVVTLREGDIVDPRYTPEDFAWQKEAIKKFNELVKSVSDKFTSRRVIAHKLNIVRDIEDNGKVTTVKSRNRTVELADGLLKFSGMYCIANSALLFIMTDGRFRGMVCDDDREIYNIFDKKSFQDARDKMIHAVKCTKRVCGCAANDRIPKFASEEEAKKFVAFAQKRQAELFAEYEHEHEQLPYQNYLSSIENPFSNMTMIPFRNSFPAMM